MNVLDHGFVELEDMLGDDLTPARIARISYMSESTPEGDKKLVDTLLKLGHESPFEHLVFTFHVKAPLFVSRQWFRHRIGSFNERSGRYTEYDEGEFYIPDNDRSKGFSAVMEDAYKTAWLTYKNLLNNGEQKEVARMVLPLATYTEFYWTVNARSLFNFLKQRNTEHAQWEIRQYAKCVEQIFAEQCPVTYQAYKKYV